MYICVHQQQAWGTAAGQPSLQIAISTVQEQACYPVRDKIAAWWFHRSCVLRKLRSMPLLYAGLSGCLLATTLECNPFPRSSVEAFERSDAGVKSRLSFVPP